MLVREAQKLQRYLSEQPSPMAQRPAFEYVAEGRMRLLRVCCDLQSVDARA